MASDFQAARFDQPFEQWPLPIKMHASDGVGLSLVKLGDFGADLIFFPAGGGVAEHMHEGDHILFVLAGCGWVDYRGEPMRLEPGVCYLVPGAALHAIRAERDLTLASVANQHRNVGDESRLSPTAKP